MVDVIQSRYGIGNSLASIPERRWPRAESICTTFSLARWPCNCPVASRQRATAESLSNPPLPHLPPLTILWFFFIANYEQHELSSTFGSALRPRRLLLLSSYEKLGFPSRCYTLIWNLKAMRRNGGRAEGEGMRETAVNKIAFIGRIAYTCRFPVTIIAIFFFFFFY